MLLLHSHSNKHMYARVQFLVYYVLWGHITALHM